MDSYFSIRFLRGVKIWFKTMAEFSRIPKILEMFYSASDRSRFATSAAVISNYSHIEDGEI